LKSFVNGDDAVFVVIRFALQAFKQMIGERAVAAAFCPYKFWF
jgi:hypothetical protein